MNKSKQYAQVRLFVALPARAPDKLQLLMDLYNTKFKGRRILTRKDFKRLLEEI